MKEICKGTRMIKGILNEIANENYSHLVKAIISFELHCDDEDILQETYDYFMSHSNVKLLSDEIIEMVSKKGEIK